MRAFFANFLEDADDALEITDVKSRQNQSYMSKVTVALLQMKSARLALGSLVRNTHARIERAMGNYRTVVFEVEKLPIGDFHHSLADNIIVCSGGSKCELAIDSARRHSRSVQGT